MSIGTKRTMGRAALTAALTVLGACGGSEGETAGGARSDSVVTVPSVPTVTVAALAPSSFSGTLPCADCAGIATTVALFSDTTYRLREVPAGKGGAPAVSMGRWTHDGTTLTLDGVGRRITLAVLGEDTLQLREQNGQALAGGAPAALVRADSMDAVRESATFVGTFSAMPEGATFRECGSGQTYDVSTRGAYKTVGKSYTAAKLPPGSGQQVEVTARFTPRPATMDGPRERDVIEFARYLGPAANPECR